MYKHASIIPLIGGMTLGAEKSFLSPPEYFVSYEAFKSNDSHIVSYYENEIPYYLLDKDQRPDSKVDVVNTTCPCAGLSQLSHGFGDDNPNNQWMPKTARYVLEELRPLVFYGENAPGFAGKIGQNVRNELFKIGKNAGYTMSVYRTRSLFHGVPQVRERSFYFFWKGDKVPVFKYFRRDRKSIEDTIRSATGNTQRESINDKTPSEWDPYYKYILEEIHGGITHSEFSKIVEPSCARGNDSLSYIELRGHDYGRVGEWMERNGFIKEVAKCEYRVNKLAAGGNLMRRGTVVPKDYIGAFVGHYPTMLTHPDEDRYINYREAMTIMGMPQNFQLLNANRHTANHICQNVPVQTAADMSEEVKEVLNGNREMIDTDLIFQYNHNMSFDTPNKGASTLMEFLS